LENHQNWQVGCPCHDLYSTPVPRSKDHRPLTVTENQPCLWNGMTCRSPLAGGGGMLWCLHCKPHCLL